MGSVAPFFSLPLHVVIQNSQDGADEQSSYNVAIATSAYHIICHNISNLVHYELKRSRLCDNNLINEVVIDAVNPIVVSLLSNNTVHYHQEDIGEPSEAHLWRYLHYRTAQIILCILGLVGNAGVILAWTASRRRRPIVALMTSLAVWDLGLLTSYLYYCVRNFQWWYTRTNVGLHPWSGSLYEMGHDPPMYLAIISFHCCVCTSVLTVLAISLVRYMAVVRPLAVRRICSRTRIKCLIVTIMTSSMFLSFCFSVKYMCLSFTNIEHSYFCRFVNQHERTFSYPRYIVLGMLPWVGTIPLSALLVVHVTRIPKTRTIRRGSCSATVDYGTRRVTIYVIFMVLLSTVTYPVTMNIFLAMDESPGWPQTTKEHLYLTSDFLFIINSIAHIFLFYAGGTFFRSLIYARITYFCACVCTCVPVMRNMVNIQCDDVIAVDDVAFNLSSTRDGLNSNGRMFGEQMGMDMTSV